MNAINSGIRLVLRAVAAWTRRSSPLRYGFASIAAALVVLAPLPCMGNPRPLPYSYPYETLSEGSTEVEQVLDYTPAKVDVPQADGAQRQAWDGNYRLYTELEYGITDRLEVAFYLAFQQQAAADPVMSFDGMKQRLRYRIGEEGDLPVDLAVYFEVSELHDEIELEQKLIISKRFGALRIMANAWVEQGFAFRSSEVDVALNPTLGAAYQVIPELSIGVESWLHATLGGDDAEGDPVASFNREPHVYLGPALSLQLGRVWWTSAVYARLDSASRSSVPGEAFGKLWVRSVLGVGW